MNYGTVLISPESVWDGAYLYPRKPLKDGWRLKTRRTIMKLSEFKKKVRENRNLCCICKSIPAVGEYRGLPICLNCKIKLILEEKYSGAMTK